LHLVATRPIKKGEELTMSYVDVAARADETPEEARRRRRFELARGWRFKCECIKCATEAVNAPAGIATDEDVGVEKDESRIDATLERLLTQQAAASGSTRDVSETD
jgi:mitochondrial import receptor subunit TOM20